MRRFAAVIKYKKKHSHIKLCFVSFCLGVTAHAHHETLLVIAGRVLPWHKFVAYNACVGLWSRFIDLIT